MIESESQTSFTVIIAVYNNVESLERCIKSFVDQDYAKKELIINKSKTYYKFFLD